MSSGCRKITLPAALDAAVAVAQPVDRGVELVVAAQRLQDQMAVGHLQHLDRGRRRTRPGRTWSRRCGSRAAGAAARSRRAVHVDLIGLAARDDPGDVRADDAVVVAHRLPGDAVPIADRRLGDPGDDLHLGLQVRAGRLQRSARGVHRTGRVLHRDPLRTTGLDVLLGPALGRQDQRGVAADQVRAVDLGRDVHRHPGAAHGLDRPRRCPGRPARSCRRVRGRSAPCRRAGHGSRRRCPARSPAADRSRTPSAGRRGSARAAAPRCPSSGRPARWSGRGPGTARRRACRCCPAPTRGW